MLVTGGECVQVTAVSLFDMIAHLVDPAQVSHSLFFKYGTVTDAERALCRLICLGNGFKPLRRRFKGLAMLHVLMSTPAWSLKVSPSLQVHIQIIIHEDIVAAEARVAQWKPMIAR
jgi:hypothetical protein